MTDMSFCPGLLKKGKDPVCWQPAESFLAAVERSRKAVTAASVSPEVVLGVFGQRTCGALRPLNSAPWCLTASRALVMTAWRGTAGWPATLRAFLLPSALPCGDLRRQRDTLGI